MGCGEKTGVLQVSGLSNWILIVRKQSLGEEVEGVFRHFEHEIAITQPLAT